MIGQAGIQSKTECWKHQLEGIDLIAEKNCVLNWEMGCGKSKAVVDFICNHNIGVTLIICPKTVRSVWETEFQKHASKPIKIWKLGGSTSKSMSAVKAAESNMRASAIQGSASSQVFLVNYESVWKTRLGAWVKRENWSTDAGTKKGPWGLVVCDEIHRIKAPGGVASKFIARIPAERKVGLTGTLMPHSPLDAWAIYRFIDPSVFDDTFYTQFKSEYSVPHRFIRGAVVGYKNLDDLTARIKPITHRVTKDSVMDLPDTMHEEVPVLLNANGKKVYTQMQNQMVAEIKSGLVTASNALTKLLRLQQITSGFLKNDDYIEPVDDSKLDTLRDIFEDLPQDEPIVVFARFVRDVEMITYIAKKLNRDSFQLRGTVNQLAEWQQCKGGEVLGAQINTGKEGIDLTRARYCIYYSMGLSLGDYQQSMARSHRPGQTRKVTYIHLIATNTVDEHVYKAMKEKANIIDYVLKGLQGKDHNDS